MTYRLLVAALFLFTVPAGAREGRLGNEDYARSDFGPAGALYREGIDRSEAEGEAGAVRANLYNNLGCALYEQQEFERAQTAFETSLGLALTAEGRAQAAYNAGNAAARQQAFEAALGFYRHALLADPDHAEAKFNYEYLRRQLQPDAPPEPDAAQPSPFAQAVKAEADSLVAARQYRAALETMQRGLATDSTVSAYGDFLSRLGAVVEIDDGPEKP